MIVIRIIRKNFTSSGLSMAPYCSSGVELVEHVDMVFAMIAAAVDDTTEDRS